MLHHPWDEEREGRAWAGPEYRAVDRPIPTVRQFSTWRWSDAVAVRQLALCARFACLEAAREPCISCTATSLDLRSHHNLAVSYSRTTALFFFLEGWVLLPETAEQLTVPHCWLWDKQVSMSWHAVTGLVCCNTKVSATTCACSRADRSRIKSSAVNKNQARGEGRTIVKKGTGLRHVNILICDSESYKLQLPRLIIFSYMLPCFGWKRRVGIELPGPAPVPSRVQTNVYTSTLPSLLADSTKVGGCACMHIPRLQKSRLAGITKAYRGPSSLPGHSVALVSDEALRGMTQGTLQDWVLLLSYQSICYGSEAPSVLAAQLGWTGSYAWQDSINSISLKNTAKPYSIDPYFDEWSQSGATTILILWV